ncbi:TPA: hypothetical protein KRA38_003621 [Clostridioides difficile]|nr:hypothetical protein [Clostridioides difficile]HBG7272514.1 hypothetical protein [Clostridioides difficile]HBG7276177.1 hypothetical protein [Clostridioides difficile]
MEFKCHNGEEEWIGTLEKIIKHEDIIEIFMSGRSTLLHAIIGESSIGRWICFPEREYACGLASLGDVYWNEERVAEGLGITDAITVAQCLKQISQTR